jgi:hypothetical protein
MGHKRLRPSFETPRKSTAPQDDGGVCIAIQGWWARHRVRIRATRSFAHPTQLAEISRTPPVNSGDIYFRVLALAA